MMSKNLPHGFYWTLLTLICLVLLLGVVLPEKARLKELREKSRLTASRCKALSDRNTRLQKGLFSLESGDPAVWERVIRDRLGWVKPGEVPIQLVRRVGS